MQVSINIYSTAVILQQVQQNSRPHVSCFTCFCLPIFQKVYDWNYYKYVIDFTI